MSPETARAALSLAPFIPFRSLLAPDVVCNRNDELLATWQVAGLACATRASTEIDQMHAALCQLVHGVAQDRASLWMHRIRRALPPVTPTGVLDPACALIAQAHAEQLTRTGLFATQWYVSVLYRPLLPAARTQAGHHQALCRALREFDNVTRVIERGLAPFGPSRLGCHIEEGVTFSSQLRLYGFLLNGHDEPVPVPQGPIAATLATARLSVDADLLRLDGPAAARFALALDLKEYPNASRAGMLDAVLAGDFDSIETHSFTPLDRREADQYLRRQRNHLLSAGDPAASQIDELTQAQDGVASADFILGEYHYSAVVFGTTPARTRSAAASARAALNAAGFQSTLIDLIPDFAWLAQLPGNRRFRPRVARLSSRNFCGLAPLHHDALGKARGNPWGEAVTVLAGPSRAPVYFNFHVTRADHDARGEAAPANTLIIGQTGSGKTVLELFLVSQLLRFAPRLVLFDKDRGAEIAMRAFGAHYRVIAMGESTGVNPLSWQPSEANCAFMALWVSSLLGPGVVLDGPARQALRGAIDTLCRFPLPLRTLSTLLENLPIEHDALRQGLRPWCRHGHLGWAFDQPETATSDAARIGFDLTAAFDRTDLMPPLLLALLYRMEAMLDGSRFVYVVTECWKALDDPHFAEFIHDKQKTIRKQNGFGIFDTQSPEDLLESRHAAALIEQSPTLILLPNPAAREADYCGGLHLSATEFRLLKSLAPGDRRFLIKQGQHSVLASLDLSGDPHILAMLSGTAANVRLLDTLRASAGDDFEAWWPLFTGALFAAPAS